MLLRILVLYWSFPSGKSAEGSVRPLRYNLTILTHLEGGSQNRYEGIVSIDLEAKKATRYIYINCRDLLTFPEKTWLVRWASGKTITTTDIKNSKKANEVYLVLDLPLRLGETYTMHMFFTGRLTRPQRYGYFAGRYDETPQIYYALTRMEPDYAHTAFPCFDSPLHRTPFNVTMVHHQKYVALSSMPAIRETPHEEITDFVWTTFMTSPPLATHQIMWALHRLEKVSNGVTATGEKITVWARWQVKERFAKAATITPSLLKNYETLFGLPLPNGSDWGGKFDQIVLPDYAEMHGGKGMMVYGEGEGGPSQNSLESLEVTLAELVARQWNGLLVTASDWNASYVRQGINSYVAFQVLAMENKGDYNRTFLLTTRMDVLSLDSQVETKAISVDVRDIRLNTFRKHKMCLLAHMIKLAIGAKAFFEGLHEFFQRYSSSSASTNQLWEQLQRAARRSHQLPIGVVLSTTMESWLKQPGYPLLTVLRNNREKKVTITQSRYYQRKMNIVSKDCWWVPVVYITKNISLPQVEWLGCLKKKAQVLELSNVVDQNEWLLLNVDAAVPVRVLYDLYSWRLLSEALLQNFSQISELSRAQLVDDALNLAWSGQLPYRVVLSVIKYLSNETSVAVWQTAITNFEKLQSIMRMSTGYRIFRLFMQLLIEPSFKANFKPSSEKSRTGKASETTTSPDAHSNATTSPATPTLSGMMYRLACQFEIKDCLTDAQQKFQKAMEQNSTSSIPEELRETVLCRGIRTGLESHWLIVRDMFFEAVNEKEKGALLNSLSCTTEYWAMQKLLGWALDADKVPKTLTLGLLTAVMRTYLGFYVGNQYLVDNINKFMRSFTRNDLHLVLSPFINAVTTKEELATLHSLFNKKLRFSAGSSLAALLEPAQDRLNWRKYNYFDLLNAIKNITVDKDSQPASLWNTFENSILV
ncbi:aminopeptidase Q [Drosophila biarmipes]|uniref:aminopeptidase Q n=1 Tax=Drosophila biarmipes TaxID=125945 RepID=UPI0021CC6904|nr:aminopeptidase Q [Drosophila biarmipes]